MNISKKCSKDSVSISCELNTRHQRSRNCTSVCCRVWCKWIKIKQWWSEISNWGSWRKVNSRCWNKKDTTVVMSSAAHLLQRRQTQQHCCEHDSKAHIILVSFCFKCLEFSTSNFTYSFFLCIWDTMTLIDLNFIQFYQSLIKVNWADKTLLITSVSDVLIICEKRYAATVSKFSNKWDEQLNDYNLTEVLNLTDLLLKDSFNLFYKQALNLEGTKLYTEGNFCCL